MVPKALTTGKGATTKLSDKKGKSLKAKKTTTIDSDEESEEEVVTIKIKAPVSGTGKLASFPAKKTLTISIDDSLAEDIEVDEEDVWEKVTKPKRPKFSSTVKSNAIDEFNHATGFDVGQKQNLEDFNAAVPHRMDWSSLRDNTMLFVNREEDEDGFLRWTDRFITASNEKVSGYGKILNEKTKKSEKTPYSRIVKRYTAGEKKFLQERKALIKVVNDSSSTVGARQDAMERFLGVFNSFPANLAGLAAHNGNNLQTSNRPHLNAAEDGTLSPMSRQLGNMSPHRLNEYPLSPNGTHVVTTSGQFVAPKMIENQYGSFAGKFTLGKAINAKRFTFDVSTGFVEKSDDEEDDKMSDDK